MAMVDPGASAPSEIADNPESPDVIIRPMDANPGEGSDAPQPTP